MKLICCHSITVFRPANLFTSSLTRTSRWREIPQVFDFEKATWDWSNWCAKRTYVLIFKSVCCCFAYHISFADCIEDDLERHLDEKDLAEIGKSDEGPGRVHRSSSSTSSHNSAATTAVVSRAEQLKTNYLALLSIMVALLAIAVYILLHSLGEWCYVLACDRTIVAVEWVGVGREGGGRAGGRGSYEKMGRWSAFVHLRSPVCLSLFCLRCFIYT